LTRRAAVGEGGVGVQVVNGTLNPTWNESFFLYVRNLSSDILKVGG
jgi:Ca2+-dependent lipid-binding protein